MRSTDILARIADHPEVERLAEALAAGSHVGVSGAAGSSTTMTVAALSRRIDRPVVYVVAHLDEADEAVEELAGHAIPARRLPALEYLPGETSVSAELFAERLGVIRSLCDPDDARDAGVLVCPIQALMQGAPSLRFLERATLSLRSGGDLPGGLEGFVRWLGEAGYRRTDTIGEVGDFAIRGGIVDVFAIACSIHAGAEGPSIASGSVPVRFDFFGDEVDSIAEIDLDTMGSDRNLAAAVLTCAQSDLLLDHSGDSNVLDLLPAGAVGVIAETMEVVEQARGYFERLTDSTGITPPPRTLKLLREKCGALAEVNQYSAAAADTGVPLRLPVAPIPDFDRDAARAIGELCELAQETPVVLCCQAEGETQRVGELIAEFGGEGADRIEIVERYVHRGFRWSDGHGDAFALVPYHELLHRYQTRRRIRRVGSAKSSEAFYEIEEGDYVVHADHGIGVFRGMRPMKARKPKVAAERAAKKRLEGKDDSDAPVEEFMTLEFAGGSKLHVPMSQVDKVQKYIGGFRGKPRLSRLGGKRWSSQKEQVKESVRDLAGELLRVQAARENLPGVRYPHDTPWQKEFEAEFPYEETEDQIAALAEIKKDMGSPRPMDRLLCGDVGYGKTELGIRAAFKAAEFGKQVAVLVPTTLLAEQHERTFRERFADYPFVVESISRFRSNAEQKDIIERTRKGQVDILIGTHRLLSRDVHFSDLGLVIIDEEQRFGVEHKNTLLQLRMTSDVLTLSATPIPRTLHMAMLGLRDISSLTTAPLDRRAVVTEVIPYNEQRMARAIARELNREGQVFVVHNRVHNIRTVADDIQRLAPDARILVGHGQMPDNELEDVMRRFVNREADILVATTIIESGIDIPTANTMLILGADGYGLADLHQLRGRVGRFKHRAYCYLVLPKGKPPTEKAVKRLKAIEEFSMLGAGFKIAMRDLEIRGAGNLLGPEQSGHIAAVGYDMYCRLLEEAAKELRNEPLAQPADTTVELGLSASIPTAYIPSQRRRLEAYRRLGTATSLDQVREIEEDLTQAYGAPPRLVENLLGLSELRVLASGLGVRSITLHAQDIVFRCDDPERLIPLLEKATGSVRVIRDIPDPTSATQRRTRGDDGGEVYYRPPASYIEEPESLLTVLRTRLRETAGVEATA